MMMRFGLSYSYCWQLAQRGPCTVETSIDYLANVFRSSPLMMCRSLIETASATGRIAFNLHACIWFFSGTCSRPTFRVAAYGQFPRKVARMLNAPRKLADQALD